MAAPIGSLYLRISTGQMWQKTGAGNTAWSRLLRRYAWLSAAWNDATQGGGVYVPSGRAIFARRSKSRELFQARRVTGTGG